MSKTIVLYHGPECADGFAAAFAAWRALGDTATYIPVNYGQDPPAAAWEAERLFILDFSFPRPVLLDLASKCREVVVLDHHRTAQQDLGDLTGLVMDRLFVQFDMEQSGALLAWRYFHPGNDVPDVIRYVDDGDMWIWALPHSREVSAWLGTVDRDFGAWDYNVSMFQNSEWHRKEAISNGGAILTSQSKVVDGICRNAYWVALSPPGTDGTSDGVPSPTWHVPVVNSACHQSEIGERLLQLHPDAPFVGVFTVGERDEYWSLLSRGGFDVSAVAKAFGGGGHAGAAGFQRRRTS